MKRYKKDSFTSNNPRQCVFCIYLIGCNRAVKCGYWNNHPYFKVHEGIEILNNDSLNKGVHYE